MTQINLTDAHKAELTHIYGDFLNLVERVAGENGTNNVRHFITVWVCIFLTFSRGAAASLGEVTGQSRSWALKQLAWGLNQIADDPSE